MRLSTDHGSGDRFKFAATGATAAIVLRQKHIAVDKRRGPQSNCGRRTAARNTLRPLPSRTPA